jgi:ethanolamine utilization protein EutQ
MARRFITAADVRRLVKQEGQTELVLGPEDVVTALAQDTARDLGLRLVNHTSVPAWSTAGRHDRLLKGPPPVPKPPESAAGSTAAATADLVAQIVTEVLRRRGLGEPAASAAAGPLRIDGRAAAPAATGADSAGWQQQEAIGAARGGGLAAGFRSAQAGTWTYSPAVNEMCYVVEGLVDVTFGGQVQRAFAGDVLFIPAGSPATFSTPSWVKVFYVTA